MARFLNSYTCPECDYEWQDEWDCGVDDDCPACGKRHITPTESEQIDDDLDLEDDHEGLA